MSAQTDPHISVIESLQSEICRMRNAIAYYEHRIAQKEIAIQELLHQSPIIECLPTPSKAAESTRRHAPGLTVNQMLSEVIPLMSEPFWYPQLIDAIMQRWPDEDKAKVKRGAYAGINHRLRHGIDVQRIPGGLGRKPKP